MLDLTATYPGQVSTADPTGFPYGRPQNITVPGDGTGTPWEELIAQDLVGAPYAVLAAAGVTPSGVPDKVGASDFLDALKAHFIDGINGGGPYTPTSIIDIDGAGMDIALLASAVAGIGVLSVTGVASFSDDVGFTGDTISITNDLDVGGVFTADAAVFSGALIASSSLTVIGALSANGIAQIAGDLTLLSDLTVTGKILANGVIDLGDAGAHIAHRPITSVLDTDSSYGLASGDWIVFTGSILTASRNYTILDASAVSGSVFRVSRYKDTSGNPLVLKREDTSTITTLDGTNSRSVTLMFISGQWEVIEQHGAA